MAHRRMFSPDIVESEEFLSMPISSQALYFHLGMNADDDGFIQPKLTIRMVGANEDDLKVLLTKRFLLPFASGVVVIKHWLIHNMIRQDRYKATRFQEEKKMLKLKDNNAYTERLTNRQPTGNQLAPQVRLGKDSIGKVRLGKDRLLAEPPASAEIVSIIDSFKEVNVSFNTWYANKTQRSAAKWLVDTYGLDEAKRKISLLPKINKIKFAPITTTPCQLRDNMAKIEAFLYQQKGKENKIIGLD